MSAGPFSRHQASPSELKARIDAERLQAPFLVFRGPDDEQQIFALEQNGGRLSVGRDPMCGVCLDHDDQVSRLHAELENVGDVWALVDFGLSRNGSFVNEERVSGQRVLHDADVLRFGSTHLLFRSPLERDQRETRAATGDDLPALTRTQRRIVVALCRPYRDASPFVTPASNAEIAREVSLSIDRVKAHLGALFELLGVEDLPHTHKRVRLAELALRMGVVTRRDLV
jgi:FHA domain